jgi:uncharacterized protein (TIGR03437 family)
VTARIAIPSALLLVICVATGPGQNAVTPTDAAPPTIAQHGIVNLASRMPSRLTGNSIARGSLISIQGFRLGPPAEEARAAGTALTPSLAGVSVRVTQGAVEIDALPIMVSATEIHALLPENAPLGEVEVRVVRNGMPSRTPAHLRVVESSFGAFSQNSRGWGPGDIRNADGQVNSPGHPAKPGEIVTLRGTGLGRANDLATQVLVSSREARITSVADPKDRAPGVDEIAFALPQETPEGCYVPIRERSGGHVSNTVTASISRSGGACSTAEGWMGTQANQPGKLAFLPLVRVALRLVLTRREKADFLMDLGYASFERRNSGNQPNPYYFFPPPGTCTTLAGPMTLGSLFRYVSTPLRAIAVPLDAGAGVTVRGADGERKFNRSQPSVLGGTTPLPQAQSKRFPLFLSPGDYTISTAGGRDVGPFSSTVHVTAPIDWTNRDGIGTVDRERGVTVKWRAARPDGWVLITAINSDEESGGVGVCSCIEHASAGSFQVPPDALANIPPTPAEPQGLPTNTLLIAELPGDDTTRTTSSGGIEHVVAFFASVSAKTVSFR